jgi:hypothetical protein
MYGYLFNSYYEAVGARHPRVDRGQLTRPGAEEIGSYRRAVDDAMRELLDREPDSATLDLVELGIHHEQQHQELLLMDIKRVLSKNPMRPAYAAHPSWMGSPSSRTPPGGSQCWLSWGGPELRHVRHFPLLALVEVGAPVATGHRRLTQDAQKPRSQRGGLGFLLGGGQGRGRTADLPLFRSTRLDAVPTCVPAGRP